MIDIFNIETAHHYGDTLPKLLKCRYAEFVLRHHYQVPDYNGMEYDQYDTPAAVYLAWKDPAGTIRAGIRLVPTTKPYMIKDLWPYSVVDINLPESPEVWEATRLFIDRSCDEKVRHQAHGEILCGILEFGLYYGIADYIAAAPPRLWDFTFRRCGWPANVIGPPTEINYVEQIQACVMHISEATLEEVRSTMQINSSVLSANIMMRDATALVDPALLTANPTPFMNKHQQRMHLVGSWSESTVASLR